jgi:hypothetical protein
MLSIYVLILVDSLFMLHLDVATPTPTHYEYDYDYEYAIMRRDAMPQMVYNYEHLVDSGS